MQQKTAMIFVNGELKDANNVKSLIREEDILVAVDGGYHHITALGLDADIIIGDLDSINQDLLEQAESKGAEIKRFPPQKDETDLELALERMLTLGHDRIRIIAALGGRFDHTLGNLFLLRMSELEGVDIRLDDGREEVFLIRDSAWITGKPGDLISLIPLSTNVTGVIIQNVKYPLDDATLYAHRSRGISNEMLINKVQVQVESGILICIHTRQKNNYLQE